MGTITELTCSSCGSSYSVFHGVGMNSVLNDFEHLFFNVLDTEARVKLSAATPKLLRGKCETSSYSNRAVICELCKKLKTVTDWNVKFHNGWSYSPKHACDCGGLQSFVSLHPGEKIDAVCQTCGETGFTASNGGMWD